MEKKWIIFYLVCFIIGLYSVIIIASPNDPAEFGDLTKTTCWIGGSAGDINCTGVINMTGTIGHNYFKGYVGINVYPPTGRFQINSTDGTPFFVNVNSGNVGIGTTATASQLHIKADAGGEVIRFEETGVGIEYVKFTVSSNGNLNIVGDGGATMLTFEDSQQIVQTDKIAGFEQFDTYISWLDDQLRFVAGNIEFFEFTEAGQDTSVFNDGSRDIDMRWESNLLQNALFMSGETGNIGLGTGSPDYKLQVNGNVVPELNKTWDLGTPSLVWNNTYSVTFWDVTPAWLESDGSALDAITKIKNKDKKIDHPSYPQKLRAKFYIVPITTEVCKQVIIGYEDVEVLKNVTEEICEIINETGICEEVIVEKYIIENQTIYSEECWNETTRKSIRVDESMTESEQIDYVSSELNISYSEVEKNKEVKYTRDIGGTITMILESIKELFDWNTEQDNKIAELENEIISLKAENQIIKLAFCQEFPENELCK